MNALSFLGKTAKSSCVNLRFCLFVKLQSQLLRFSKCNISQVTSAQNSISKPPNLKIFLGRIPPDPFTRLVPSTCPPVTKKPSYGLTLTSQKWDLTEQKFLRVVIMLGHHPKIIFSPGLTFYNDIIQSLGTVHFFRGSWWDLRGNHEKNNWL